MSESSESFLTLASTLKFHADPVTMAVISLFEYF